MVLAAVHSTVKTMAMPYNTMPTIVSLLLQLRRGFEGGSSARQPQVVDNVQQPVADRNRVHTIH